MKNPNILYWITSMLFSQKFSSDIGISSYDSFLNLDVLLVTQRTFNTNYDACYALNQGLFKLYNSGTKPPPHSTILPHASQSPFPLKYKQNIGRKMEFRREV